jgi:hypothetical protein
MKGQAIYIKFKVKYNKKETLRSIILQEQETLTLAVDSEEEDEEEVWAKVEAKSFVITMHSWDIWQGTSRTLVPRAVTITHSNMLLRNVQHCCLRFRKDGVRTR